MATLPVDTIKIIEQFGPHLSRASGQRLDAGAARGEIRPDAGEVHAWAIAGMNVFLGMRYGLWDTEADIAEVARVANDMLANGLAKKG
jgi:hypothetical protein